MKLKKSKLRKIISEELLRVVMEKDIKRYLSLKEGLDSKVDEEGRMAKSQLLRTMKNAEEIAMSLADDEQLEAWVQSKITKSADYLQSVLNYMNSDSLEEEMQDPSDTTLRRDSDYVKTDSLGLTDPHATDASQDDWFNNIQVASRILEDLPLDQLPDQVTMAAKLLRDSVDLMTNPLVEEE